MKETRFTKMHGAGNDFILVNDAEGSFPLHDHIRVAALAARRLGVGSEGVIILQKSAVADFRMVFFNPDGTEADLCGNGTRCAAAFAKAEGMVGKSSMTIETAAGLVDAEVLEGGLVRIWMPEPRDRRYSLSEPVDGREVKGDSITVGVPHFVVESASPVSEDVERTGRALRLAPGFAPDGTNVDFVQFRAPDRAFMRTYERGVEAETGACGTGAAAVAVVAVETRGFSFPVAVRTAGGFNLTVDGYWHDGRATGITLTGPAKKVFSGTIDLDSLDCD